MGGNSTMGLKPNWSPEEIQYLQDYYGTISIPKLSENLNRSVNAIKVMRERLGLGAFLDNGEYITLNQMMHALGRNQSYSGMLTSWVKNRGLPIKTKKVENCSFRIIYLNDFWKWAEQNRTFVDFSKVPENSLGEEPRWVREQRRADTRKKQGYKTTPWTHTEDEHLKVLLKQFKYGYSELSKRLQRTSGAIQRRIVDLGLKERPLKADNHKLWSDADYMRMGEMIKQGLSYELMADELGRSSKALRGRVFDMYLTESLDKVIKLMGSGHWGDGRPERPITFKNQTVTEKIEVKNNIALLAGIIRAQVKKYYGDNDYWQKDLCMNWDGHCTADQTDCDSCTAFIRIREQYCRRCGTTFFKRQVTDMCDKCKVDRKKQAQRKWAVMNKRGE